jgi:hypothetical protein
MPRTDILQSSPPISIPPIFPIIALVVAAAAVVFELDMVEEAVVMGIDMPLIDSIVDVKSQSQQSYSIEMGLLLLGERRLYKPAPSLNSIVNGALTFTG